MIRYLVLILSLLILAACSQSDSVIDRPVQIKFAQLYEYIDMEKEVSELLKELDGVKVTIKGYMAQQSPVDNSFIYLVNIPYMSCPFCTITDNTKLEVITVLGSSKAKIKFTDNPVQVTGRLEVKPEVDSFGYTTQFRILADKITEVQLTQKDIIINSYYNTINENNLITALQISYINIDSSLNSKVLKDKKITDEEKIRNIKANVSSDYFSEGVRFMSDSLKFAEKVKPKEDNIFNLHNKLISFFEENITILELLRDIMYEIEKEPFISSEKQNDLISLLVETSDRNIQNYNEYTKWNNLLRE